MTRRTWKADKAAQRRQAETEQRHKAKREAKILRRRSETPKEKA